MTRLLAHSVQKTTPAKSQFQSQKTKTFIEYYSQRPKWDHFRALVESRKDQSSTVVIVSKYSSSLNPRTYKEGGGMAPPIRFFFIFQDELLSIPAFFSSCAHIPWTHFDTSLVRLGCYGYEI